MSDSTNSSLEARVTMAVRRLLAQRGIERAVATTDDLRQAGLTLLDMINLVLSVEAAFQIIVPEESINPANFRSIEAVCALIVSLQTE